MSTEAGTQDGQELLEAVARRRNFAIISHPDAGKTTLTEKLLLYGGAIQQAGAVKARGEQRKVTSDWMELEKQRGISITSTVLQFDYTGNIINLLDTPGHQDFSEDTYRTLAAADNAVMLEDAAKGLEPQTRKLFEVCRMRQIPIFTFINKMDRPGREPLALLDEIEAELELTPWAVNWPIGSGEQFRGVIDRRTKEVVLFSRAERGKQSEERHLSLNDPELLDLVSNAISDGLFTVNSNARILKINSSFTSILGYKEEDLSDMYLHDIGYARNALPQEIQKHFDNNFTHQNNV